MDCSVMPLTVIVATTQPWPELRMCLDSLCGQTENAEVIVVDGHGQGLPDDILRIYPWVTRLSMPGASVLQMRASAMCAAKREIVAVTEDHCRVASDWCRQIIEAHRRYPDAAAIGGAVENGADRRIVDWASFFIVNGAAMPPLRAGAHRKIAGQATVSYKKRVIPREAPPLGRMEWMLNHDLRRAGEALFSDDRVRVDHVQSFTFHEACAIHYHDSRTIAGFRLDSIGAFERAIRLGACFAMPPFLFLRTVLPVLAKRARLGWLFLSLPMIGVLVFCRAAGAFVGFIRGPGESPLHIR
ncbi:MAG: glycosyltransferase [Burkholderiales bacterium]